MSFTSFLKRTFKVIPLLCVPLIIKKQTTQCFFWEKQKPNVIEERLFQTQFPSNNPCQDRSDFRQLTNYPGYAAAIYDGHGGWQVSELCSKVLLKYLDECLAKNKQKIKDQEQLIKTSIRQAFKLTEQQFLNAARIGYNYGFGRFARAGSCALVCVVCNNKVYTGNAGDSLGILIQQSSGALTKFTQLNRQLNANHPEEQERLKKLFKQEDDIVICKKPNNTSCYVKGRLQPTRSIGDLRLKHAQFNNPKNYQREQDFQPPLTTFSGNYITWQPQIKVFQLTKAHRWIVMASDGLWDELQRQEVAEIVKGKQGKIIPNSLVSKCLQKAFESAKISEQQYKKIPKGKTRKIHDDLTVVVLDLKNQCI